MANKPTKLNQTSLIKNPNTLQTWTNHQLEEIQKCGDPDTGPRHFLNNYFYIQHPTQGKIPYQAFPYQEGLLDAYSKHIYSVSLLSRQMGKCFLDTTLIKIKNNSTQKEYNLPVGVYYEWCMAKKDGLIPPDISKYVVKSL